MRSDENRIQGRLFSPLCSPLNYVSSLSCVPFYKFFIVNHWSWRNILATPSIFSTKSLFFIGYYDVPATQIQLDETFNFSFQWMLFALFQSSTWNELKRLAPTIGHLLLTSTWFLKEMKKKKIFKLMNKDNSKFKLPNFQLNNLIINNFKL